MNGSHLRALGDHLLTVTRCGHFNQWAKLQNVVMVVQATPTNMP